MSYLALYRKFRPKTFDELIGQEHITKTLMNQIMSDKISHAYLFCGSRGTGKTSTAKIFAKAINCENPQNGSPCFKCETCLRQEQSNMDIFEIDAASNNRVEEIRDLREKVKYPPLYGKYKVYIIDEVHMLSDSAFNALLKTLEEPPKHVVFILATTEVHKLPATILSRCLRFDFNLIGVKDLSALLKKVLMENGVLFDEEAVDLIARAGAGSARDMLSIADMCISYCNNKITYKDVVNVLGITEKKEILNIIDSIINKNTAQAIISIDAVLASGKSPLVLAKDLIEYFKDLLVVQQVGDNAKKFVIVQEKDFEIMKQQATKDNFDKIVKAIEKLSLVEQELRYSVVPRLVLQVAVIRAINDISCAEKIAELEKKIKG